MASIYSCKSTPDLEGKWTLISANFEPIGLTPEINNVSLGSIFEFKDGLLSVSDNGMISQSEYDDGQFNIDSILVFNSSSQLGTSSSFKMVEYENEILTFELVLSNEYLALPVPNSAIEEWKDRLKNGYRFGLKRTE